MFFLSDNHFSVDIQINDVVNHLHLADPGSVAHTAESRLTAVAFLQAFPEYNRLSWSGSWVDPGTSFVDQDYMSWVADWIEQNTAVTWWEGEPVIFEDKDNIPDGLEEGDILEDDHGGEWVVRAHELHDLKGSADWDWPAFVDNGGLGILRVHTPEKELSE